MRGPLEHLLVVDASEVGADALAGMIYADYGATVVIAGRGHASGVEKGGAPGSDVLEVWDRNKLAADPDDLEALLARADILIGAPSTPDGQPRWSNDEIAQRWPQLVYARTTAFGDQSPWGSIEPIPALVEARLGVMAEQDGPSTRPHYLGHPSTTYATALLIVIGTLAALRARRAIGTGQRVDASFLDGILALSTMNWWWNEKDVSYLARSGTDLGFGRSRIITDLFECADGEWIVIHTGGTGGFKRALDILGVGENVRTIPGVETSVPLDDDEYHAARVLAPKAFAAQPRHEWLRRFHAADLAALPVLRPTEVFDDEQVKYDRVVERFETSAGRHLRQVGRCITFSSADPAAIRPAPRPGEYAEAVRQLLDTREPLASAPSASEPGDGPLAGLRVLDFSSYFAGPYGARLLSDLGADVIKIEPLEGDPMRPLPDPFEGAQRGKRAIAVDLKSPRGLQIVHRLVATADVVMHNFRPGKADRLGIGENELRAIKPDLIYCYLPGFGSSGPKSGLKSFAPLLSGFVGNFYEGAGSGRPPVRRVIGNEDYYNGLSGAVAVLMALECRESSGRAQSIESAQLRSALFATSHNFLDNDGLHMPLAIDGDQRGSGPLNQLFPTTDGWVMVAASTDRSRAALRSLVALDDDAAPQQVAKALEERSSGSTVEELLAWLAAAGVPCEAAVDHPRMPELLWDEWLHETGRVLEQHHPSWGWIREIGLLSHLSRTPGVRKGHGPILGQDTKALLEELGYEATEIADLVAAGVCVVAPPVGPEF
ncbi:CaiB/BaiF CoA-transferase family protein [Desertimonas flava]|uniref:CaiB/BaiF CoA-transferase family protein n=1 Tax=Desertimonas flava TaxID=2064846 RepID=UPI000E3443F0|nr:CoA transferase [Desertimonas flava]